MLCSGERCQAAVFGRGAPAASSDVAAAARVERPLQISKVRTSRYTGERTLVLQTCASDGGLKTFFCRLGLGISPAGIVADAISAMGASRRSCLKLGPRLLAGKAV